MKSCERRVSPSSPSLEGGSLLGIGRFAMIKQGLEDTTQWQLVERAFGVQ